jgi:tRNA G18 (ribose-2'-O)-methylase SpoU
VIPVVDPADPRLADYQQIRDRDTARDGYFIVEGMTAIERLLTSAYPVRSVLLTAAMYARIAERLDGVTVYVMPADAMSRMAGVDLHRGAVASAGRLPSPDLSPILTTASRLVLLEGINDHENLGAIARTARGLGADALILDPTCADPFYRRSVRVSMGELLRLPIVRSANWPATLDQIEASGFAVWSLTPAPSAADIFTLDVPPRWAIAVGAEGPGLRAGTIRRFTPVRIPMQGGVDSLNVGHAVAVALARR